MNEHHLDLGSKALLTITTGSSISFFRHGYGLVMDTTSISAKRQKPMGLGYQAHSLVFPPQVVV